MENETEVIDSTTDEETVEETVDETEETTLTVEDYKKLEQKNKELYERAKRAEALAKEAKNKPAENLKTNNEYLTREEAVLLAKGYDEEDLNRLNLLAKADGKKLTEVTNDEMFIAWKEKKDEKVKAVKAQLGSSKSSTSKTSKPVSQMTPEEHKAYWQSLQ